MIRSERKRHRLEALYVPIVAQFPTGAASLNLVEVGDDG